MWINLSEANWTFKMDKESLQSLKRLKKNFNSKYFSFRICIAYFEGWWLWSWCVERGLVISQSLDNRLQCNMHAFYLTSKINLNFKSEVGLKIDITDQMCHEYNKSLLGKAFLYYSKKKTFWYQSWIVLVQFLC